MSVADQALKFISDNNGKSLEAEDPSALDQCMDEAFKYLDVLGIDRASIRHQYAYQVWEQPNDLTRKYFDLLPNTPTFIPQVGDIAVFKRVPGIPVGHISTVASGSTLMNMVSFDQNWDTEHYNHGYDPKTGLLIPYCRQVIHYSYYGVAGFLRPKSVTDPDTARLDKIRAVLDSGSSASEKLFKIRSILS